MAETATKIFLNISKSGKLNDLFFVMKYKEGRPVYISPETAAIISYNTKVGMWTLDSSLLIESFVASSFVFPPKTGWTYNLNISGNLIPKLVLLRGSNTSPFIL